jgi:hypothetical protein
MVVDVTVYGNHLIFFFFKRFHFYSYTPLLSIIMKRA